MSKAGLLDTPLGICVLKRSDRKTLGISVLPDQSIELAAPLDAKTDDILNRVHQRRSWINRQRRRFTQMNVVKPALKYCSGATHRYLGKQYRLKVCKSKEESVKLIGAFFLIHCQNDMEEAVQNLVDDWFRTKAKKQFERRVRSWDSWCKKHDLRLPRMYLRKMSRRWGSSHRSGKIFLNPDLIRAPSLCVDYVITHEICHLMFPNHDRRFYKLLSEVFPNWKCVKLRLEQAEL